jgi:hypothetical protein
MSIFTPPITVEWKVSASRSYAKISGHGQALDTTAFNAGKIVYVINTLCPPAAATTSARLANSCPRTSEKSRSY